MTAEFNRTAWRRIAGPVSSVALFAIAVWVLRRELQTYGLTDILHSLSDIPHHRLVAAIVFTVLSYAVTTGYDALALRYVRRPLAYRRIGLASFIGYAFSNNIGLSMIAGASVRFRLYSAWGLSAVEISQVVVFCTLSLWMGFLVLGGAVFLFQPETAAGLTHAPVISLRWIGLLFLLVAAAYMAVAVARKTPFQVRGWSFRWPGPDLALWQFVVGALDWCLAARVLHALIGWHMHLAFGHFLVIFLVAQLAGLVSQVPGGLGVFESVVVVMLSGRMPFPQIIGALLVYRALYYWAPLVVAALLLGLQEILRKKAHIRALGDFFGRWVSPVVPQVLGLTVFVGGAILLLSGATPALDQRLVWLKHHLPLFLLELSHFIGSVAGMGLLLLGRALQRRLDAAYVLTLILLAVGIASAIVKGLDYEEALVLLAITMALLPCRRYFYRKTALFTVSFSPRWVAAVLIVLGGSIWLGFYSYRHVEYADSLWWQFAFNGNASRFLRASLGAVVLGLYFALARLLRPAPHRPELPGTLQLETIWPLVQAASDPAANLVMLGDKYVLRHPDENAFIMYGIEGRSWIAMGDPVGPPELQAEMVWRFHELADLFGGRTVFYEVSHDSLHLYLDLGLSLVKLGEEARVSLPDFDLDCRAGKEQRYALRKLEKEGCRFDILPASAVAGSMEAIREISDAWLSRKNTREKSFSLGFFNPEYLKRYPLAVVYQEDRIVGFANLWQGAGCGELSMDLMRYLPEVSAGVMDYLIVNILLWGKARGYQWFNLGMAPLSGFEARTLAPLWSRLGAFVFQHGEHFYNFQGLRQYKAKFNPRWSPKYLVFPGVIALPQVIMNLSALIGGGFKGLVTK